MADKPELVSKPGSKSCLWNYFGLRKNNSNPINKDVAICRTCYEEVASKNENTSNLLAHLRTSHGRLYAEAKAAMKESSSSKKVANPVNADQLTLHNSYPTRAEVWSKRKTVERANRCHTLLYSKGLSASLHGWKIWILETLWNIWQLLRDSQQALFFPHCPSCSICWDKKTELSTVNYFSATSDLWSSNGTMVPYIVHFLNENWRLQSRSIQTKFLPEDHTGEVIADSMEKSLLNWELNAHNQVCIITDSGSNVINATKRLNWSRMSCFGHHLHLGVTKQNHF